MIRPTEMPSVVSSAIESAVSCTGISSSSVTTWTAALGVREGAGAEERGDALAPLDLDEEGTPAAGGQREGQRGGDRGLPGAALAGHHVQPGRPTVTCGHLASVPTARGELRLPHVAD